MAIHRLRDIGYICLMVLFMNALMIGAKGIRQSSCPTGWTPYDEEVPASCLWLSDVKTYLSNAYQLCKDKNASLVIISSEKKYKFVSKIISEIPGNIGILLALQKINGIKWWTKDGHIPATILPAGLNFTNWHSIANHRYNRGGIVWRYHKKMKRYDNLGGNRYFICEKEATCKKGWSGLTCDKECHCHAQDCLHSDLEVTCKYGCQRGWMGKDCSKPKEEATVRYFCVNSNDQGKYAHVRIDTKGVLYDNIHAVNEDEEWTPWCNNTDVKKDNDSNIVTIKIQVDNITKRAIQLGTCAGELTRNGNYEWRIKIQEKENIVSRNDQEVNIECDFENAESFQLIGDTEIKRERGFRRSDIRKPVEYLEEISEEVTLNVVDPYTGNVVEETHIGSPVALKLSFGIEEGSVATGVIPYSCYASTPDLHKKVMFLDINSCPSYGFHISAFHRNSSKTLVTDTFPLFGFDETEDVEFRCSYILCFGNDHCPEGCHTDKQVDSNSRVRRSTMTKASGLQVSNEKKSASKTDPPSIK